jgi:uncharacterized protein YraI
MQAMPALVAILLLASAASAAANQVEARWSGWLRVGPGMQYAVLDEIPAKSKIDVQSCANDWCLVKSGSAHGYVNADLVNTPPAPPPPAHILGCVTTQENGYGPHGGEEERFCGK